MIAKPQMNAGTRTSGANAPGRLLAAGYVWLLWFALIAASAALIFTVFVWQKARSDNEIIGQLASRHDVAVSDRADPAVRLARLTYLTTVGRLDDALPLAESISAAATDLNGAQVDPLAVEVAVSGLYNMANARLRRAIELIGTSKSDQAPSSVRLAKEYYARALRLNSGYWNARYNLDIASRLVRDLPEGQMSDEDEEPESPKRLWTDLPGIPKGLP